MTDTASNTIVRKITPAEREAIDAEFAKAYISAVDLVQSTIMNLRAQDDYCEFGETATTVRRDILSEVHDSVCTIGTPEFQEHPVLTDPAAIPEFDIRTDYPIILLAWCRSWAHTAFLEPDGTNLERAIEVLEDNIINGKDAEFDWLTVGFKVSPGLKAAVFNELREKHKLIGGWQVRVCNDEGSTWHFEATPPHCTIPFRCEFSLPIVRLDDGSYELMSVYNRALEAQAIEFERQAAEMVEEAVQKSMLYRIRARDLRVKMRS